MAKQGDRVKFRAPEQSEGQMEAVILSGPYKDDSADLELLGLPRERDGKLNPARFRTHVPKATKPGEIGRWWE